MTPLADLGTKRYHGYTGGLYGNGKNAPSAAYLKTGLAAAKRVHPIDGRVVLLSIGMSNTTQEFSAFKRLADSDARKSPQLTIVDGAQGGRTPRRSRIRPLGSGASSMPASGLPVQPPHRSRRCG